MSMSDEEIDGAELNRIRHAAKRLELLGDATSARIVELQSLLHRSGACAHVERPLEGGKDCVGWNLGYGRIKGKWMFIVTCHGMPEPTALLNAPLSVRLDALGQLNAIVSMIATRMEEIVAAHSSSRDTEKCEQCRNPNLKGLCTCGHNL